MGVGRLRAGYSVKESLDSVVRFSMLAKLRGQFHRVQF
jgi:hypothetical protein